VIVQSLAGGKRVDGGGGGVVDFQETRAKTARGMEGSGGLRMEAAKRSRHGTPSDFVQAKKLLDILRERESNIRVLREPVMRVPQIRAVTAMDCAGIRGKVERG